MRFNTYPEKGPTNFRMRESRAQVMAAAALKAYREGRTIPTNTNDSICIDCGQKFYGSPKEERLTACTMWMDECCRCKESKACCAVRVWL